MKNLILISLFLFIYSLTQLYSQDPYHHHPYHRGSHYDHYPIKNQLEVNGMYYSPNYQGIKSVMHYYKAEDPDVYAYLLPEFKNIQHKRNAAIITFAASSVVGSALIIGGMTFWQSDHSAFYNNDPFFQNTKMPNAGAIIAGIFLTSTGSTLAILLYPNRNDIFRFINAHNRSGAADQIEWKLGLAPVQGGVGLSLAARF